MRNLRYLGLVAVVVILGAVLISGCSWFQEAKKPEEPPKPAAKPEEPKPAPKPAVVEEKPAPVAKVTEAPAPPLKDVFFDFDKYNIRPDQRAAVEQDANWLRANPNAKIVVEGHCDERGTSEYNMALGERRAKTVKDALASQGVDAKRVQTISYGKEKPFAPGHSEEDWAKNRRGHFVIPK